MSLAAAAGLMLLLFAGPGCSSESEQAPNFQLPPSSFPDIVALAAKDPAAALKALGSREGIEAAVLRAHLLERTQRYSESATMWETAAGAEPALATYALRAAVRNALAASEIDRARAILSRVSSAAPANEHTDLALQLASRLRIAQRHDEARAVYRDVLAAHTSGARWEEARLGLAESLAATGDKAGAQAEYRRVRLGFGNYEAYLAATKADARGLTASEYQTIIDRLLARSRYDEAIRLYEEQLKNVNGAGAAAIEAAIIDTFYRARENQKARDRIRKFRSAHPNSSYDDELTVLDFRLAIREPSRVGDVKRLGYEIMRGRVSGVSAADERSIGRLLGSYLAAVGQTGEALDVFRELFQSSRSGDEQSDLLWRAGITAIRHGDIERGKGNLEGLIARNPGAETVRIARFWVAHAEDRLGNKDEARRIWTSLADEQPLDYYGLRSADRLGRVDRLAAAPAGPDLTVRQDTLNAPEIRAARVLAAAGLTVDAAAFARQAAERIPGDLGIAYEAARASAAAGEFRAAHSLMARRFPSYIRGFRDVPPDFMKLFWPLAFEPQVVAASKQANLDPHVMLSIARRESRFDPSVRSVVGAIGLFQFMPYTARELAAQAGVQNVDEAALKTPEVATRLAATYLSGLLKRYDGELAPAAAAYNAGEELVDVWWKAHKSAGTDLFAEMIPYSETRGYVREVVANYETYKALYKN